MKNHRIRKLSQRVRYALIAGMAGTFLMPQVVFAGPTGEHDYTSGVDIQRPNGTTTTITATAQNNVINWRDYSVNQGELVQYDGGAHTNNYLNIVTGANTSNINGKIEGGKNVYIVNPNGVIFGKAAEVNVGNLYVSTQDLSTADAAVAAFANSGTSPLDLTASLKSDVVNMGKITADTVEVHGAHIRFLNAADVTAANRILYTDTANGGYAHIGYERGHVPALTDYTIDGASAVAADNYYQLVATKADLDDINTNATTLAGNYMLANDIDFANAAHTPIGGNAYGAFTGKFDGNFFQIQNINVSGVDNAGFFGDLGSARIENLGIVGGTITSNTATGDETAGGIAGNVVGAALYNVYVKETQVDSSSRATGGLIGAAQNTTIDGSYSKAQIGGLGGGIVGSVNTHTTITNVYNASTYIGSPTSAALFFGGVNGVGTTRVENSYTRSSTISSNDNAIKAKFKNVFGANSTEGKINRLSVPTKEGLDAYSIDSYSGPGMSINNDGAPGAKWRIYEGRTLPLLTAFMNGRVDSAGSVGVEYKYRKFNKDGTLAADFAQASNSHADITKNPHDPTKDLIYDSKIIKIVADGSTSIGDTSNVAYDKTLTSDDKNRVKTYTDTNPAALDRDSNIRNAGTKAMLWSDQDGPNLRGVNITIAKRKISVQDSNLFAERMYDGTKDVTAAFKKALENGGLKTGGFTEEDLNDTNSARKITITPSANFAAKMDDKNVGDNKTVNFTGKIEFTGTNKDNYEIGDFDFIAHPNIKGKAKITKAPLILNVLQATTSKVYDGTDAVTDPAMKANPNVRINETLTMTVGGNTVTADIKTDEDSHNKDDVSMDTISDPTYVKADGSAEIHAGDNHIIRYKNVKLKGDDAGNYELYYKLPSSSAPERVTGDKLDLKGDIKQRGISKNDFKVYKKADHSPSSAVRVYDGTDSYTPDSDVYLSSNVGAAAAPDTGIVDRDRNKITFALVGDGAYFTKDDNATRTTHVSEAKRITYNIKAATTDADAHRLSDYYYTEDGTTKAAELTDPFVATGAGRITPKALTAAAVRGLDKTYDGMAEYTDGSQNVKTGDAVVTLTGWTSESDKRTNASTAVYVNASNADDRNVAYAGNDVTTKNMRYTAKLTGTYADDYAIQKTAGTILSAVANSGTENTTVTADLGVEANAGTINPRNVDVVFKHVTKVYDGTANNNEITADSLDDGLNGRVFAKDGTNTGTFSTAGIQSRYGTKGTPFREKENASDSAYDVEYKGISNSLGGNYKIESTKYGTGTITRRLIENSGFQVRKSDGTLADAAKVYDGTDVFALKSGEKLVARKAADPAAAPNTGIVAKDEGKIHFKIAGDQGHFIHGTSAADRTSHVSEADHVAYNVIAKSDDETNSPLSNYYFGTSYTDKCNLEAVNGSDPKDAVTAQGRISAAVLTASPQYIEKVYDRMAEHTDGNRNVVKGDSVVTFTGWVVHNGTTEKRDNTSTAVYADKDVARDPITKEAVKKSVTYTAQLSGKYASDYKIVDGGNESTRIDAGDHTTVTLTNFKTVADGGKITPRRLNITMGETSKRYDRSAANNSASVAQITGAQGDIAVNNTILGADGVTAGDLQAEYRTQLTGDPTLSSYGRGTGAAFTENVNASNGTKHDVRYKKMKTAFDNKFSAVKDNYEVDETVYGKGTITRKEINGATFKVSGGKATKVYDGTSKYTVAPGRTLEADTGEIIAGDVITFAIDSTKGANFTKNDGITETKNVADARKVAYHVTAAGDAETLRNYTLNGKNLEAGDLTASGDGEITRRVLSLDLVQKTGIDKTYDGAAGLVNGAKNWNALTETDNKGNVKYADGSTAENKLVTTDGSSFEIKSSYRNDANTSDDKDVKYNGTVVDDKKIQYKIAITGGDANNYSFDGTTSAASGLKLSATGKITPKDLSGAFKRVEKVYDGTTSVPSGAVGFDIGTPGGVVSGDVVAVKAGYGAVFESPNVKGSGTSRVIGGAVQHNWVNYTNVELDGAQAGNYKITPDANGRLYGLGEITPFKLDSNTVINFGTVAQATKIYDGTYGVKRNESAAPDTVKGYIQKAEVQVGTQTLNLYDRMSVTSATYDVTKDVNNGTSQGVTYNLTYTPADDGNIVLAPNAVLKAQGTGVITKRDVTVTVKNPLTKQYDAGTAVKDASGNVITGAALNNLVELTNLTGNDNATYTTTAVYTDKNAGTGNRIVNYTVNMDAASAGNYNLKYNNGSGNVFSTNNNTIEKRTVKVNFKDVSKTYDTTTANPDITGFISDADAEVLNIDHTGIAQADPANNNKYKLQNLGGLTSNYGAGGTDATFNANADAGEHKDVQYAGLRAAMNNTLGTTDAANYEFDVNGYGKGKIDQATINTGDLDFGTPAQATKTYDGTTKVKKLVGGVESADKGDVKGYIPQFKWNGHDISDSIEVDTAEYDNKNVNGGAVHNVKYTFKLSGANKNFKLAADAKLEKQGTGIITKRDVTVTVKNPLTKQYDAGLAVKDASGNVITGTALNDLVELTNLTGNDGATYTTTAVYTNKDADTGNKVVNYTVNLDAASAGNYNLKYNNGSGNVFSTNNNTIEKRTVKVNFKDVSKTYDTTTANPDITGFISDADAEVLNIDHTGIAQADPANNNKYKLQNLGGLTSNYGAGDTDATFNANADAGENKDVQYAGLGAAMNNTLGGAASNYEFDVNGYGKGKIGKKTLNDGDVDFNFDPLKPVTKIYDGGTKVKYLESDKPADVKNYFTNAMWNGHNILDSLEVDTAEYDNKNVNGGAVHNITYKFKLSAANKNFELGTNLTKAGTGKITPKDLSASFRKITKQYDGTTAVNPAAVGFEFGAVAAGDDLTLATHTESFQSSEIDGDGTTAVINGTPQKNWINYSNLSLGGTDAGNYTLNAAAMGLGEITPVPEIYVPDAEYNNTLAQMSKMLPNEYAYENASLDRRSHFGRDAEAEVSYTPPSINMVQDGMDLAKADLLITDRAVFAIVNEVFG